MSVVVWVCEWVSGCVGVGVCVSVVGWGCGWVWKGFGGFVSRCVGGCAGLWVCVWLRGCVSVMVRSCVVIVVAVEVSVVDRSNVSLVVGVYGGYWCD